MKNKDWKENYTLHSTSWISYQYKETILKTEIQNSVHDWVFFPFTGSKIMFFISPGN